MQVNRSGAATVEFVTTETDPAADEAEIRRLIDELAGALRAHDLDAVMSIYASDVVSFDIEPPLRHVGGQAKRKNWERVFAAYECPLEYDVRELTVTVGEGVAFAHSLNRLSGTLRTGVATNGFWVRATMCLRKLGGRWVITHDQVSVPLDLATGAALVNLEP